MTGLISGQHSTPIVTLSIIDVSTVLAVPGKCCKKRLKLSYFKKLSLYLMTRSLMKAIFF